MLKYLRLLLLLPFLALMTSCASSGGPSPAVKTTGNVLLTPLTVVRDVVDVPLVTLTNVFETFAGWSNPRQAPQPTIGWSWKGGFDFGIGYAVGYYFFKGLSGIFGGIDYVICRSFYPSWPSGLRPWKRKGENWGKLYFPNTRALWGDDPPDKAKDRVREPAAAPPPVPAGP